MQVVVFLSIWINASFTFLETAIIGFLSIRKSHIIFSAVDYALISTSCFAFADVLISQEAQNFGNISFLLVLTTGICVQSLLPMPFFQKKLSVTLRCKLKYPLLGAFYILLEKLLLLSHGHFSMNPPGDKHLL